MSRIWLRPGDVFVSADGYAVRLLTAEEQETIARRVASALRELPTSPEPDRHE